MNKPIICLGQQPNGFFPKQFFVAKLQKAQELQKKIDGTIIWFCHDSDSDYRETITTFIDKQSKNEAHLNFAWENKIQKKFSPLYAKRISKGWQEEIARKLPQYINKESIEIFNSVKSDTAAGFCIRMYQKLGLLNNVQIVRSSDPALRRAAVPVTDFFMDTQYENEIVRARYKNDHLELHSGGENTISLPLPEFNAEKISPARDSRFQWMQSVINCTHYILGAGERSYLDTNSFPNVEFIERETVENPNHAWVPNN